MKQITLDTETTIRKDFKDSYTPSPHHKENELVWLGFKHPEQEPVVRQSGRDTAIVLGALKNYDLVVGHNVKFDLHTLQYTTLGCVLDFFEAGGTVWDTMVAEYLLDGGAYVSGHKGYSLDAVCERRGLPLKPNNLKEKYWSKGISTEDIPAAEIIPYLKHDVTVTEELARRQMQEAVDRGLMPWMMAMMESVCAVWDIEAKGIHVDREALLDLTEETSRKITSIDCDIEEELGKIITGAMSLVGTTMWPTVNLDSPEQLSKILFGGVIEWTDKEFKRDEAGNIIRFKSGPNKGKPRTTNVKRSLKFPRLFNPALVGAKETKKRGVYTVGEGVLSKCGKVSRSIRLTELILERRHQTKVLSTYLLPYAGHLSLEKHDNDLIHPSFLHTVTPTGRLSCTYPNIQNVRGDVKGVFTPGSGEWVLLEADYSQLEIRVLAQLSGDEQLKADLDAGIDLHRLRAAEWLGKDEDDVTEDERRKAKSISFQLQYGASAKGIARDQGITEGAAQRFIDTYYKRYPKVREWQEKNFRLVQTSRQPSSKKSGKGVPLGRGVLSLPYGRTFTFYEKESTWGDPKFYKPDIKNYPVQGVATGDIVQICLGRLWRKLRKDYPETMIVNTVHDSFLLEVPRKDLTEVASVVQCCMEEMPNVMQEILGFPWDTQLPADLKVGESWGNMTKEA